MAKSRPPIKKKYIETPEKMWELFLEYEEWAKCHPILKHDFVGKDADEVYRKLERPLTIDGFEVWLSKNEIITDLANYIANKDGRYESYIPIIARIKAHTSSDMKDGAAVGIYQQNIIARMLGLSDKQDTTHANPDGTPIKITLNL